MFPAMNKTPHAKLTDVKRTHWVTKQEYSNSHQLPEKTSTKYRGSLTLRSPHTRRNRCKLSVSAGMPATNDCKNHSFMQIKKLQTAPRMSTHSGKSRNRVDCEKRSFLPLFLALAAILRENFHHFIGTGACLQSSECAARGEKSGGCWSSEPSLEGPEQLWELLCGLILKRITASI